MVDVTISVGVLTLLIEVVGLFFVKKQDRSKVYFIMLFTIIMFFTAWYYTRIA